MIRYRYALCNGAVVGIESVDERMRAACSFVCFSCGGELVARLGAQKQWHFAHKSTGECAGESYLHKAGKALFLKRYAEGGVVLRYPVERVCVRHEAVLGAKCVVGREWQVFDLSARFTTVLEERRDGRLIPDICLVDGRGEKIYIEIAVTHRCAPEKIASGVRMVEFLVEREADLAVVGRGGYTLGREPQVLFHNFTPPQVVVFEEGCARKFWAFEAFSSGKHRFGAFLAKDLNKSAIYRKVYAARPRIGTAIQEAMAAGVAIKDCSLCVQADVHRRVVGGGIWCRFIHGVSGCVCDHFRQKK